nr:immunoglobulin heavy chain junction region [Macaca mulatta]MOW86517.1 immunoglobulin heavy chain junction region [Macaca mulatta]MOW86535.1 immunoglobulin heavy chain junction region [Macaca mulatta]MOW86557.1 immunoglobulin heavy chain junction region [Macaca mulatta]MOW86564.1 immunoglobulin heavy chain junction region [Macaca mulatta]
CARRAAGIYGLDSW